MDNAQAAASPQRHGHKRSRSAVLKSIIVPSRNPSPVKKSPSKGIADRNPPHLASRSALYGILPRDHPHAEQHAALGEINYNRCSQSASPKKSKDSREDKSREYGKPPGFALRSPTRKNQAQAQAVMSPQADQENTTPPSNAFVERPAPIWAQFSSQALSDPFTGPGDEKPPPLNTSSKDFGRLDGSCDQVRGKASGNNFKVQPRSRVGNAVAVLNGQSESEAPQPPVNNRELDAAFEAVLNARNIPENMRQNMRLLDATIKAEFIRNAQPDAPKTEKVEPTKQSFWGTLSRGRSRSNAGDQDAGEPASPSKRSRSRSRTFTLTKGDRSPSKRARSNSRPRSLMLLKNLSSSSVHSTGHDGTAESKDQPGSPGSTEEAKDALRRPDDYVKYLRGQQNLQETEVGRLHKLRLLLRNETVSWVDTFILKDGMKELLRLLNRLRAIEWREEHDDLLLHEVLLCLKGLCTTERALNKLSEESSVLFPDLLNMLFDEERRGPSEFNTRGIVINLLYTHLATSPNEVFKERAESVLAYLSDPAAPEDARPVGFILQMQQRRPYQRWCKEIANVTKEVFWIFLHHLNVISVAPTDESPATAGESYRERHFPKTRPPVPAASWVGGVEWEACNYLTSHLDVMNGLIAATPSQAGRNQLREELRASGFEKIMGGTLRTCKEKFYGSIHDALRTWIVAAAEDAWPVGDVKMGPPKKEESKSPSKSPKKGDNKAPPQLELPKLDLGVGGKKEAEVEGWL